VVDDHFACSDEEVATIELVPRNRDHARSRRSGLSRSTFLSQVDLVRKVSHFSAGLILYSVFTK
jgi:hypothetical protein